MYGRTKSQEARRKTHFALYSGGTWTIEVYPKNFRPLIRGLQYLQARCLFKIYSNRGMYGRTRSMKVGRKTHFALYTGGT
jgi:hypothetical protein